jgi:protein involved in polysaccharide export with SLBB domain
MSGSQARSPSALGALLLALVLFGCSSRGTPLPDVAPEINSTYQAGIFVLAPGDLLTIAFEEDRVPYETPVLPDGKASFHQLGDIHVAGLTVDQLDQVLTQQYGDFLEVPGLSVTVQELGERSVAVMGQVKNPGAIQIQGGRMSLLDALGHAGGPNSTTANLKDVMLVRWLPIEQRVRAWHMNAHRDYWGEADPILLQPFDVLYVPETAIVSVNTWVDQYIRRMLPFPFLPIPLP